MKKHLFLTALVLALVMCFSCGALAADIESGYVNDYKITGLDKAITEDNVTIMTVGQWREANDKDATETFFDGGEALADDDIIIMNKEAAIVLAVGTRNPWGYPNGSVLDAGVVKNGTGYRDTTWSIEFLANWWDSWAPGNGCGTVEFEIVLYDFEACEESSQGQYAVKVTRNYTLAGGYGVEGQNNDKNLEIVTYYGAPQEGSYLYMFDGIENKGDKQVWYNGYEDGGAAAQGTADAYENIAFSVTNKGDDGAATYGKGMAFPAVGSYANTFGKEGHEDFQGQYLTAFVVPAVEFESNLGNTFAITGNGGKSGYQELYITNISATEEEMDDVSGNRKVFEPGEKVQVEAYIVCSDKADHAVLNDFVAEQQGKSTYEVVVAGIEGVEGDMQLIVSNADGLLGWFGVDSTEGGKINLPAGDYTYKVEVPGYTASAVAEFTVTEDGAAIAPALGTEKVEVTVNVTDKDTKKAIYAKVATYNENGAEYANSLYPTVRFVGDSIFYSKDAKNKEVTVEIPAGVASTIEVMGEGYYFTSEPEVLEITADQAVEGATFNVEVEQTYAIQEGYIGGDVHHHTNKNDAFALPEDIVRSFLVSGLDVVATTDHDYTVNNARTYDFIKGSIGEDLLGYMPSVEISCSWAHFNVVPLTEDAWNYYVDADVTNSPVKDENGIALAFTNLKYFLNDVNSHGASLTANHPWYSYGLFTALASDAIPGGYTDGYDMIGLNGSYRDQEMSKTIVSGFDLWDGYIEYVEKGEGSAVINGVEVPVASTHYYAGGSDTHDVLTPYATNKNATSDTLRENREEFFTGKVRSYAAVETEAGDYAGNAIAYGNAMINGNSYTTTGPILELSKVPGNNADGKVNAYPVNEEGAFDLEVKIGSLDGIRDILVLTDEGEGNYYAFIGKANTNDLGVRFKRDFKLSHVDTELSIANSVDETASEPNVCAITNTKDITNEYTYEFSYVPETAGLHWVAVCVVDIYGNFAVTNAYWVNSCTFADVDPYEWYYDAVAELQAEGIVNGDGTGNFQPEKDITRAEFAQMLYKAMGGADASGDSTPVEFSDLAGYEWAKEAINYLSAEGIITGYPDGTFKPGQTITRAEMAVMIYRAIGLDEVFDKTFTDVPASSWYYDAVMVLGGLGIVNGVGNDLYAPEATATKAQAAQIIVNVLNFE